MDGVLNRYQGVDKISQGVATIKTFKVSEEDARFANMRLLFGGASWRDQVHSGEYVKLYVDGHLMMSDTHMERITNTEFVENARGKVMIAGLGLGLILNALKEKVDKGEVTSIVVYEKYQDVIDLVGNRFKDLPLEIRCEDILTYKPKKGEMYDTIYFDIWPDVCTENLPEMATLHQRWKTHKTKGAWMSSWRVEELRAKRKAEQRSNYW